MTRKEELPKRVSGAPSTLQTAQGFLPAALADGGACRTGPAAGELIRRRHHFRPPSRATLACDGPRTACWNCSRWPALALDNLRETAMAKQAKTLDDLFHDTLKDIYYAEKKILIALPKMAKAAQSAELRKAFEKHERETESQVDRLEQVFRLIEQPAKGKKC
jgi:hypothetical protein